MEQLQVDESGKLVGGLFCLKKISIVFSLEKSKNVTLIFGYEPWSPIRLKSIEKSEENIFFQA